MIRSTLLLLLIATLDSARRRRIARAIWVFLSTETPGQFNAITDVPGVAVGHTTLISGEGKLQRAWVRCGPE